MFLQYTYGNFIFKNMYWDVTSTCQYGQNVLTMRMLKMSEYTFLSKLQLRMTKWKCTGKGFDVEVALNVVV